MARQWRIQYKGALYHVMSRGNHRMPVFMDDEDRNLFLDTIEKATERFSIEVYAYVLMKNHYHLLLKTIEPNLSKTMQWIGTTYTCKFNLRHNQSGHLFQGRYKSILVENDAYLTQLSWYIHCNPLRAGMVDRLSEYSWSSYNIYAYKKKAPFWLNTDLVLAQTRAKDVHRAYRLKVQRYSKEKISLWEDVKHSLIYGSDKFIDTVKSKYLKEKPDVELPQHNRLKHDIDPNQILKKVSHILNFDPSIFTQPGRLPKKTKQKRDMLIFILRKMTGMSNQDIGILFGLSYSAISKVVSSFEREYRRDEDLVKQYMEVISNFKV